MTRLIKPLNDPLIKQLTDPSSGKNHLFCEIMIFFFFFFFFFRRIPQVVKNHHFCEIMIFYKKLRQCKIKPVC